MAKKVTLQQLERLCAEGRDDELLLALKQSRFEDLRALLGALGVKVRTKEYAAYRSKDDHVQLLAEVLQRKAAGVDAPLVPREVTPVKRSIDDDDGLEPSEEQPPQQQQQLQVPPKRSAVDRVGGFLVAGTPMSSKDAERAYLVQCINIVDDALTNAEAKKDHVPGLKRTLTCELAYFVKRLKRIQEKDVIEDDDKA
ncbi:hypothetical protein PR003_g17708 [Phytophthora rubi]|uniref:Uncharacterized protein n=1 Tax=Phytophthora rubi TaxID=129364 RepID=A0A6A3KPC8_9STRA|nr:hypothetical protein PR002_g19875 [Phytophthora rubi]KAE9007527.1 hypothetical protein PR001_g16947 [Phytophthora rubi]KAE9320464.1 hypothetical protein PR003_g17708 [Phytophthora rubi]